MSQKAMKIVPSDMGDKKTIQNIETGGIGFNPKRYLHCNELK